MLPVAIHKNIIIIIKTINYLGKDKFSLVD